MANINQLLYKFAKDQPYSEHLEIIARIHLPEEYERIVKMLTDYNKMLINDYEHYEEIRLFSMDFLSKFFTMQKESDEFQEIKKLIIN